jgi:hypothetical protein
MFGRAGSSCVHVRRELAELLGKVALAGVRGYVKMVVDGGVWERSGSAVAVHSIRRQDRISRSRVTRPPRHAGGLFWHVN